MKNKQSCCICCCAKNEHDFINRWLEYHIKIGISHFYILIDNLYETQDPYNINEEFKEYVTLVIADKNYAIKHNINLDNKKINHSNVLIHKLYNTLFSLVKEDWISMCALDNYIYLYKNIDDFLTCIYEENPNCSQIIMPWINISNLLDNNIDNFPLDLGYSKYFHIPVKSCQAIIKKSNLKEVHINSHTFISKSKSQIIYLNNSYKSMPSILDTFHIFDLSSNYWQPLVNKGLVEQFKSPFIIHNIIRNYDEVIIKDSLSWKKNNKFLDLKNFLEFKSKKINSHLTCRTAFLYEVDKYYSFNLKLPRFQTINLIYKNTNIYYNRLIKNLMLSTGQVNIDTYYNWKIKIKNYILNYLNTKTKLNLEDINYL